MANINENCYPAALRLCIVSFVDLRGIRHAVEVQADSLYEAVVLGVSAFREVGCEPGDMRPIEVEVRKSVTHTITLGKVSEWLNGGARSPKEAITKERLRALLSKKDGDRWVCRRALGS